jgi:glycosyltransferase involved in cell wall biosynthesis
VAQEKTLASEASIRKLRLAVEVNWSQKEGGARRVASCLVRELAKREDIDVCVFMNAQNRLFQDGTADCRILYRPWLIPQVIWDQFVFPHLVLPRALKRHQPDITLFTNNLMSVREPKPAVVILHDLTPFIIPETYRWVHGLYQRWYFRRAASRAAHIITVSERSKNDITRVLGVPSRRISVVRLGAELLQAEPQALAATPHEWGVRDHPFILYAGAQHPRKNIDRLLRAFIRLKEQAAIPHRLLIVGAARWKQTGAVGQAKAGPYGRDIVQAGRVSDSMLAQLYRSCAVFVYPSLYEGFGLPVLEAMSMGAPVVTSQSSSMAEITGDAAILVDPLDVQNIADGIASVLQNRELADALRAKGLKRAKEYTWDEAASAVCDVIQSQVGEVM